MTRYAHIIGWGKYVPPKIVTNEELSKTVDTSDSWIRERSGIGARHIASSKESTALMAVHAAGPRGLRSALRGVSRFDR